MDRFAAVPMSVAPSTSACQQVSSQVSFCLKELLKKHPGMKGPVVKETASESVAAAQWPKLLKLLRVS